MRFFFLLLSQLAVGGSAFMLAVPRKPQLMSFFRFASGLFLFLTGLALASSPAFYRADTWSAAGLAEWQGREILLTALFGVGLFWRLRRLRRVESSSLPALLIAIVVVGLLAVISQAFGSLPAGSPANLTAAVLLRYLLSASSLGAVITGMLFGHWYLNVPGLEVPPYRRIVGILIVSLALQAALDALVFADWIVPDPNPGASASASFRWYMFWGRWVIALAGSWVIAVMAWWVLRNKATQAATGLLYVGVLLVLAGELIGHFLVLISLPR